MKQIKNKKKSPYQAIRLLQFQARGIAENLQN
jgi:hypothetical protein